MMINLKKRSAFGCARVTRFGARALSFSNAATATATFAKCGNSSRRVGEAEHSAPYGRSGSKTAASGEATEESLEDSCNKG